MRRSAALFYGSLFVLTMVLTMFTACSPQAATPAVDESLLLKTWYFSYEESNSADSAVYRPEGTLQSSRGRTGMTFASAGAFTYIGIAPADGPLPFKGTWKWADSRAVRITVEGKSYQGATWEPQEYDLEILSLAADKLIVKKR